MDELPKTAVCWVQGPTPHMVHVELAEGEQTLRYEYYEHAGEATARVLEGLSAGTYYWQVRTAGGGVPADNGAWHHFTVSRTALFSKQAPVNGATELGSTLTLQWTAVPNEGYWGCWDTVSNNTCDTTRVPTGWTSKPVEGLAPGTFVWPFDLGDPWALRATLSPSAMLGAP
jgi:hypothetical protein